MSATSAGVDHVEHVMGMAVSFDIRNWLPGAGFREVLSWLHHVDATFSTYRLDSEISRFGLGEIEIDDLTPETEAVLLRCIELTEMTDGAFDVFSVPAANGSFLDPSGLVKGWSVERAAAMLEAAGADHFCINAGGDIALRGRPEPERPWVVGIRHPWLPHAQAIVLEMNGPTAIATSATYERGAHIIDPRTGEPATALASATVVGPDLATADAFATAVFVMGLDGLDWIEDQPDYSAYMITHDDTTAWSSLFPHPTA